MGPDAQPSPAAPVRGPFLGTIPGNDCNTSPLPEPPSSVIKTDQQPHLGLRSAGLPDKCGNPSSLESMSFRITLQSFICTGA